MEDSEDLVLYCIPSLVATLLNKERAKGEPLTEDEVIAIRDSAPCVALPRTKVKFMDDQRGYVDIDANDCWNQWQIARKELNPAK